MVQNCADQTTSCRGAFGGHASMFAQLLYAALYGILTERFTDGVPTWPSVFDSILGNLSG